MRLGNIIHTMIDIELLQIEPSLREEHLHDRLQLLGGALTFNGHSVAKITVDVIAMAQRDLTASPGQFSQIFKLDKVSVATYHFEEQAIYLAVKFSSAMPESPSASRELEVGAVIRAGPSHGQILIEPVSAKTSELILELMDCLDLNRISAPSQV